MSYDAFTLSALTIIIVCIIVIVLVSRSRAATEMKMRKLARNLTLLQADEDAVEICRKIHKKYPELCAGIDFTLKEKEDGHVEVDEWNSDKPKPDD